MGIPTDKKFPCSFLGGRKINFVVVFVIVTSFLLLIFLSCFIGKKDSEVVQNQVCIDLLFQEFRFFGMKVKKSVGMFQIAERNFAAPSHVIAVFDIFQVKRMRKIGNDIFVCILSSFDFQDTELHEIKMLPI